MRRDQPRDSGPAKGARRLHKALSRFHFLADDLFHPLDLVWMRCIDEHQSGDFLRIEAGGDYYFKAAPRKAPPTQKKPPFFPPEEAGEYAGPPPPVGTSASPLSPPHIHPA